MPTSVELRQERARVVQSLRALTTTAEDANRNLDATELETYNRHEAEFTALTERISRAEALEQREAEDARSLSEDGQQRGQGDPPGPTPAQQKRAAFLSALRRGLPRMPQEQRALVENGAGEILVPEDLEAEIIRGIPDITVIRSLASTRGLTSNRVRRRSLAEVAVGWGKLETGEQTLTDSMPGTPVEEYTYVEDLYGLAKIGEDELDDTDVNLEAFVKDSFTRAIGEAEDTGFTIGSGHPAKQPVGIFHSLGGVPTVAASNATYAASGVGALILDDLKKLIYATPPQYRRNGAFLMSSATELFISTRKDNDGRYYWQESVQLGRPNTILGYGCHNQEDIASIAASKKIAAFGDFAAGYRIYDRLGISLKRLEELYAEEGMIGWKVRFRVGGDVIRPEALRILATPAS